MNMPSSLINVCLLCLPFGQFSVCSVRPRSNFWYKIGFLFFKFGASTYLKDLLAKLSLAKASKPRSFAKNEILPECLTGSWSYSYLRWKLISSWLAIFLINSLAISLFRVKVSYFCFLLLISYNFLAVGVMGLSGEPWDDLSNSCGNRFTYAGLYSITRSKE